MKNITQHIIKFFLIFVIYIITYLLFAFAVYEIDAGKWSFAARYFCCFIWILEALILFHQVIFDIIDV